MPRSRSEFVRALRGPLLEDARQRMEREVLVACRVGLLLQVEVSRGQLAERAEATEPEVKTALANLKRIAPQLEREDRPTL